MAPQPTTTGRHADAHAAAIDDDATAALMADVRRLRLSALRRVDDLFAGEYHSAFKGQGIEFDEVRAYQPGDEVRSIDWNVTARAGRPFVKRFREERRLTVQLVVDVSASGVWGSGRCTTQRLLAEAGAILGLAAQRNNDSTALTLFSDGPRLRLPPARGATHQLRLLRELLGAVPAGAGRGMASALERTARGLKRRSIIFLASDFLLPDPESALPELGSTLRQVGRRLELVALRANDPRQTELPSVGLLELRDPETGAAAVVDTSSPRVRRRWAAARREHAETLARTLRESGCDLVELSTEREPADDLARYFRVRERRRARR